MQFGRKNVGGTVIVMWLLLGACFLMGCAGKEGIYQGMYDGLRTREQIVNPQPAQLPREEPVSYQQYKSEREEVLKKDGND
ncbi:MAG: hypothetical protein V1736_07790 [Pseudomonadota bacterium]